MPLSLTPSRHDEPELMDAPGLPETELADTYRVLARINRQLGNSWTLKHEVELALIGENGDSRVDSLLDVGSGAGDIAAQLRPLFNQRNVQPTLLALDHDPTATRMAADQSLLTVRGDALCLPFSDRSVDVVTAVKFAHHFAGEALVCLIKEMARVARKRVIVLDIRRHWVAYWGIVLWSRVFTRNRLVRYDGPLSVLRGFTREELATLARPLRDFAWVVRSYPGFQVALVGERITASVPVRP